MDETNCIVCFANYDDEDHRPRIMPCGHTNCSKCLEKAIRENSKMCPKYRKTFTASNVMELVVNFSLESLVTSLNISKGNKADKLPEVVVEQITPETNKSDNLPECAEHQLTVSDRCTTHKSWVCKSCLGEDHSTEACKIITIAEELDYRKALRLDKSQPLQNAFEESCKKSDDCKNQFRKLIEDNDEDVIRYETIVKRIQEEIQRKKSYKIQMEKHYAMFDQNLEDKKCKRSFYDKAVSCLNSSATIKGVSKYSVEVQNEATKLQLVSDEIDNEVDMMQKAFLSRKNLKDGLSMGNHKLSESEGMMHLHALQAKNTSASAVYNIQFSDENDPPTTDGVLTFLDIAWPGQTPQRVYIKMNGNTARARQHLLFMTGQCGQSYKDLDFGWVSREGQPGETIIISSYDGNQAAPLLADVTVNDGVMCGAKAGLVSGATFTSYKGNSNNGLFAITLIDEPGFANNTGFGSVTKGLDVLKELANYNERAQVKIVDSGIVLF